LKTPVRIVLLSLLALSVVFLFSCTGLTPVSVSDRLGDFITSLNGDRNTTYENFATTVGYYSAIKSPSTTWNVWFDNTDTFTSSAPDTTTPASVTVTITGTKTPATVYIFSFEDAGTVLASNYVITDIVVHSSGKSLFFGL
jgi:hypothetical protein